MAYVEALVRLERDRVAQRTAADLDSRAVVVIAETVEAAGEALAAMERALLAAIEALASWSVFDAYQIAGTAAERLPV